MNISSVKYFLLSTVTVLSSLWFHSLQAQTPGPAQASDQETATPVPPACGFDGALEEKLQDPTFRLRQESIERGLYLQARQMIEQLGGRSAAEEEILTIPLVIHIIHLASEPNPGDGPSNPTDAQILAGIEHMNQAFRNTGPYAGDGRQSLAALQSVDVAIEFCLAERDINGNPTTGILRYASDTYSNLSMDSEDPQMQQWVANQNGNVYPGSDYANVWLVNEICSSGSNGCSVAGYAYFPGNHGSISNGVINRARYWGSSTNNSKVHIHEFGHYLNLYHTFQGSCNNDDCLADGDRVCDTPPDASTSYSSCGEEANSCTTDADSPNSPFQTDVGDLYENYMDYSSNSCQNTFTQGQKDRMRAALLGSRSSLLNSQACIPVDAAEAGLLRIISPDQSLCATTFTPVVEVQSNGNQAITSLLFGVMLDGVMRPDVNWSGNIPPGQTAQITLDQLSFSGPGSHQLVIEILSSNGGPDPFTNNNVQIREFQYADPLVDLPSCEELESGMLTPDWVISNPDNGVGFETYQVNTCGENGNYVIGLQTWGAFPGQSTVDDILTQSIDLAGASDVFFNFDVAYATYYSNFNTVLEVSVSTDCGISYTTLYEKTGNNLSTARRPANSANDPGAFFVPEGCGEWMSESISLNAFIDQQILIRIRAKTEDVSNSSLGYYWGNNLYLDNLCIDGTSNGGNNGGGDPGGGGTDCTQEELELINGAIPGGTYDNVGMIIAGEQVVPDAQVIFEASESIVLLPGFSAEAGTTFTASIVPCQNNAALVESSSEPALLETPEAEELDLMIAPNPFSTQTRITFRLPEEAQQSRLSLTDMHGRTIREISLNADSGQLQELYLDRDGLPGGLYLIVLQHSRGFLTRKLMVVGD